MYHPTWAGLTVDPLSLEPAKETLRDYISRDTISTTVYNNNNNMVPLLYLALRCPTSGSDSRLRFAYRTRCVELLQSPQGRETFECMSYAYQILINSPLRDQYDEAEDDERDSVAFLSDLVELNQGVVEPSEYFMQQWGFLGSADNNRGAESFILGKFTEHKIWNNEEHQNLLPTADTGLFKRVFPAKHVAANELHLTRLLDPSYLSNVIGSPESLHSFFDGSCQNDFSAPFAAEFLYLLQDELVHEKNPKHKSDTALKYFSAAKRAEQAQTWFLNTCQNKANIPKATYVHILYYVIACELLGKLAAQWHEAVKQQEQVSQSGLDSLLSQLMAKTNDWLTEDENALSENIAKTGENEYSQNFFLDSAFNGFTYHDPAKMSLHESLSLSDHKCDRTNGMWTQQGFLKEMEWPWRNEYYRLW